MYFTQYNPLCRAEGLCQRSPSNFWPSHDFEYGADNFLRVHTVVLVFLHVASEVWKPSKRVYIGCKQAKKKWCDCAEEQKQDGAFREQWRLPL